MNKPMLIRHARVLTDALIEATRKMQQTHPGQQFQLGFKIHMATEILSDSMLLSWLDKVKGAVQRFDPESHVIFEIEAAVVNPVAQVFEKSVNQNFEAVMKLETPSPKLVAGGGE